MSTAEVEIVSSPSFLPAIGSNLTVKQNLFIYHYLQHRNGVKAARLAGYDGNDNVLNQSARANLQNPTIRDAIEAHYKARLLSKDGVLAELSDIAAAPWQHFTEVRYGDNGEVINAQVKLSDKIKAAELVGKFHGLFTERSESVNINIDLKGEDLANVLSGALSECIDITPEPTQD